MAMGNKRMCGSADVTTDKRRICADAKCGCAAKTEVRITVVTYITNHESC